MIPIGRRRLVLTLVAATRPPRLNVPAAFDATDAELARLGRSAIDGNRIRWEAMAAMYGPHLP